MIRGLGWPARQFLMAIFLTWFSLPCLGALPTDCEVALSGSAQTFIRLINEGVQPTNGQPAAISKAHLRAMTVEKLNPLATVATDSVNSALKSAFAKLSKQIELNEAHVILNHVAQILNAETNAQALTDRSRGSTAPIFAPTSLPPLDITNVIGPGEVGSMQLHHNRDGKSWVALSVSELTSRIEIFSFESLEHSEFVRRTVNVGWVQKVRFFSDSNRDLWAGFVGRSRVAPNQIEVRNLNSGEIFKASSAGFSNESLTWYEDGSGRKFVAVWQTEIGVSRSDRLEIFEVDNGLKSILAVSLRKVSDWKIHSSRDGKLFVTFVDPGNNIETWDLGASTKVAAWKIPKHYGFTAFVSSTGEVFLSVAVTGKSKQEKTSGLFYRSGHPEPIYSDSRIDFLSSGEWHETEDGRILLAAPVHVVGGPSSPTLVLALFEPFNPSSQKLWRPKLPRLRKFLLQTVLAPYIYTTPVQTFQTPAMPTEPSGWIQKPDGRWAYVALSLNKIASYNLDHQGHLKEDVEISIDSTHAGTPWIDSNELLQDPVSREWIALRWNDGYMKAISLSSSTAGPRAFNLGTAKRAAFSPAMSDGNNQLYLGDIDVQRDSSQLGVRALLNIYSITRRLP